MYIITRMNLHQLEPVLFVWLVVRGNWSFSHNIFCLFHACFGLILPSLAKLRTMFGGSFTFCIGGASTREKYNEMEDLRSKKNLVKKESLS
ncbi:hypothetical protein ACB092_10G068800 [Castanea dentata]